MKVLVTGAAGFIGSHVVDAFAGQGDQVIGLDSLDPGVHHGAPEYLRPDVDYCFADLRFWEPDDRFLDVELVVHLAALGGVARAAREPANIISANCLGTARLVAAASNWPGIRRFILAGSFSVYGSNYQYQCGSCGALANGSRRSKDLEEGRYEVICPECSAPASVLPIVESTPPDPLETYGSSKLMQELCLKGLQRGTANILRFSSVYGSRLRLDDGEATIIAKLAGWIRSGKTPRLFEDGRQIRDWVYVGDVVEAILRLADGAEAPPIVNVCSGGPTTLTEACECIGSALQVECIPEVAGGYRRGDMRHCLGNPNRLTEVLGRAPIPFRQGASLAFSRVLLK